MRKTYAPSSHTLTYFKGERYISRKGSVTIARTHIFSMSKEDSSQLDVKIHCRLPVLFKRDTHPAIVPCTQEFYHCFSGGDWFFHLWKICGFVPNSLIEMDNFSGSATARNVLSSPHSLQFCYKYISCFRFLLLPTIS